MRERVAGPVKVRRGQSVHFTATLRKDERYAFFEVFAATGDEEPSPYVPTYKMQVKKDKPAILAPTTIRLNSDTQPKKTLTIVADAAYSFYLMQSVDTRQDVISKGKIRKDGKISKIINKARGWLSRNR